MTVSFRGWRDEFFFVVFVKDERMDRERWQTEPCSTLNISDLPAGAASDHRSATSGTSSGLANEFSLKRPNSMNNAISHGKWSTETAAKKEQNGEQKTLTRQIHIQFGRGESNPSLQFENWCRGITFKWLPCTVHHTQTSRRVTRYMGPHNKWSREEEGNKNAKQKERTSPETLGRGESNPSLQRDCRAPCTTPGNSNGGAEIFFHDHHLHTTVNPTKTCFRGAMCLLSDNWHLEHNNKAWGCQSPAKSRTSGNSGTRSTTNGLLNRPSSQALPASTLLDLVAVR
ncbi:hypothetical protein C8R43DRAFT_949838 [Mycena crocata]|nr:hypothetical protein C8R43DRAFT_949838 [Mycena crocata]